MKLNRVVPAFGIGLALAGIPPLAQAQSSTDTATAPIVDKPMSATLSAEHYMGFRADVGDFTQFLFDGSYEWPRKTSENSGKPDHPQRLRLIQGATKFYEVAQFEPQFRVEDTQLFYYYRFTDDFYTTTFGTRIGATIPLSDASRNDGIVTKASLMLTFSKKFLDNRLTLALWPYFRYQFNQYSTGADGLPLKRVGWGTTFVTRYDWMPEKLFTAVFIEPSAGQTEEGPTSTQSTFTSDFSLEAYTTYEFNETFAARLGYVHSEGAFKEGRYEINLFDELASYFYLATDVSF